MKLKTALVVFALFVASDFASAAESFAPPMRTSTLGTKVYWSGRHFRGGPPFGFYPGPYLVYPPQFYNPPPPVYYPPPPVYVAPNPYPYYVVPVPVPQYPYQPESMTIPKSADPRPGLLQNAAVIVRQTGERIACATPNRSQVRLVGGFVVDASDGTQVLHCEYVHSTTGATITNDWSIVPAAEDRSL